MYKNIQTPHSPLSPLPPRIRSSEYMVKKTPNLQYLTPLHPTKNAQQQMKRRSFTPNAFENMPPPSVSPIQTVFESPESDLECSAILKKSVSSAMKLAELVRTPPHWSGTADRKAHSFTVNRDGANTKRRAYHCQRKYDNRPYIHIDITSLRRSLLKSLQSPSMAEDNGKKTVRWNDSPMMFDYTKRGDHSSVNDSPILLDRSKAKTVQNDSPIRFDRSKVKPTVPLINMYTPQKERVSPQIDGNDNTSQDDSPLVNESVLNNNLNIESVLKDIGMQKYIEKFLLEEIDLFVFLHLLPQDLYELNIDEKDHETILQAIQVYAM